MLQALVSQAAAWMLCGAAGMALVLFVLASPLLSWFGHAYVAGVPAMRILLRALPSPRPPPSSPGTSPWRSSSRGNSNCGRAFSACAENPPSGRSGNRSDGLSLAQCVLLVAQERRQKVGDDAARARLDLDRDSHARALRSVERNARRIARGLPPWARSSRPRFRPCRSLPCCRACRALSHPATRRAPGRATGRSGRRRRYRP